ncbi:MAG TPA: DEAD/DEAH box helicase [Ideonella sp.]|uniref:DEAD/DEAH box helicase n=1 Tax=Ideonella sp. TaxID=1929293 RepID=UPI002E3320FB|nr:DEAD/DEAH box helicase [Ideonella sp.]HEX5687002.1 DEAD/DEAH box helicase [Ideonella sp.]
MPFASLGLSASLQQALFSLDHPQPTPVQAAAIPPMLAGRDLLVQARTGSGKTVAFALPLLQQWQNGTPRTPRPVEGLVLVPTRELALQVGETLRELAHELPGLVKIAVVFGGVSINPQMMGLRGGADIVVATPGRLLDLVRQNALKLNTVRTLVLDEADRLLALGFADELAEVLALLPKKRQTVLCSATLSPAVKALAATWLHEPQDIRVAAMVSARPDIHQRAIIVDEARRTALLKQIVQTSGDDRVLVFVATQYATEHVADKLRRGGIRAEAFHGDLSQGARVRVLDDFKARRTQVLVATDMAARGLHIDALPVVVNYDLPRAADDYIHRIGRTGRAGGQGDAISFITPTAEAHFRLIEKRQGQRVPRETLVGFEPTAPVTPPEQGAGTGLDPNGGVKGHRKSKKDKLREAAAKAAPGPRKPSKSA